MGREAIIAALCCLMISGTRAVNSLLLNDQVVAENAPRLYRQASGLVYASAAPYGAHSFHIPVVSAPHAAASRIVPIQESLNRQHATGNSYLKDSYGNRFVEALQSMKSLPIKPFPQQYVKLQELPAHFAQPLSAAPPAFQQYQAAPQVSYRGPSHAPHPTSLNQHYSFPHAGIYADTLKNFSPASFSYGPHFGSVIHVPLHSVAPSREAHKPGQDSSHSLSEHQEHHSAPVQSSGHRAVQIESPTYEQYHHSPEKQKFQRVQEAPRHSHSSQEEPAVAPARHVKHKVSTHELVSAVKEIPIKTVVNGKKTIVNVETKPPLPLLDINLLEPLTFANPLVPQVQHFLPRIHDAKYHTLPELNKHENKKYQKEFVVQKTKSYDSGTVKAKPKKTKKKQKIPEFTLDDDDEYIPAATARPPVVTVAKTLEEAPEIVYEINMPNYKETIKQKAVKYNKETNSEPVHYTYGTKTNKEPVTYSYSHSSKEPLRVEEVNYGGKEEAPKHLIYNFKPEEQSEKSEHEAEDSGESAELVEEEAPQRPHPQPQKEHPSTHEAAKTVHHYVPEHREVEHAHTPSSGLHHNVHHTTHEHRQNKPSSESHHVRDEYHHRPSSGPHQNVHHSEHEHHHKPSSGGHHEHHTEHDHHHKPSSGDRQEHHSDNDHHHKPSSGDHHEHHSENHHRKPSSGGHHEHHSENDHHHNPSSGGRHEHHNEHDHHHKPSSDGHHEDHSEHAHHHKPSAGSHQNVQKKEQEYNDKPHPDTRHNEQISSKPEQYPELEVIPYQYEEDIGVAAQIRVDPNQHVQPERPQSPHSDSKKYHEAPATHVSEKTKQVYIKEETPEDDETVGEQLMKSLFGKQANTEQDFENAYKNAAYGFPAYDKPLADIEKDIYNPASYGAPAHHSAYVVDHAPFQQYQSAGDDYPKAMRLIYKDESDKTKEDYFQQYSASKPESLNDRHKNKESYYKLYKDQTPEKYVAHEDEDSKPKSAKLTAIPYSYYPAQKDNKKQYFSQYKAAPLVFEYDYSKGVPVLKQKDNSAHASRPFQRYQVTHFVEPQFQYGFEPLAIPRLLDSELAAMASNNSPDSEKPGTRKKIYKENFYIKKTSMSDVRPNS